MYPDKMSSKLSSSQIRISPKQNGEIRIISADIALMSSKKNHNDATARFVNQMTPTKAGRYTSNIVYAEASEGLHTEDQALVIRKLYDEFQCDYIVLDTNGKPLPSNTVMCWMQCGRIRGGWNANPSGRLYLKV